MLLPSNHYSPYTFPAITKDAFDRTEIYAYVINFIVSIITIV